MLDHMLEGLGLIAILGALFVTGMATGIVVGFWGTVSDAKARLTGEKPVDDFWRRQGMKDFGGTIPVPKRKKEDAG